MSEQMAIANSPTVADPGAAQQKVRLAPRVNLALLAARLRGQGAIGPGKASLVFCNRTDGNRRRLTPPSALLWN